jgi:hypothetical protein
VVLELWSLQLIVNTGILHNHKQDVTGIRRILKGQSEARSYIYKLRYITTDASPGLAGVNATLPSPSPEIFSKFLMC